MKKLSHFALGLIVAGSLGAPLLAFAQSKSLGEFCQNSSECSSGYCDPGDSVCYPNPTNTPTVQPTIEPVTTSGGCPAPLVEDNGQCYSVNNGVYTRVSGTVPGPSGGGLPAGGGAGSGAGSAAPSSNGGSGAINMMYLAGYKNSIVSIINDYLVPVLIAVAFIVFLWGIFKYFILGASNESDKGEGRKFAMWGVIGFVIILSLWGIVNIVKDTLVPASGSSGNVPAYPKL